MTDTKKFYRVPGKHLCLSRTTHPGRLTEDDIRANLRKAIDNSLENGENWVQTLIDYWYMEGTWDHPRAGHPKRFREEEEIEEGIGRLMGDGMLMELGDYEDRALMLKRAAGLGKELVEVTPEEQEELEEAEAGGMEFLVPEALYERDLWD